MLIDTHCHIHESDYPFDAKDTMSRALLAGVSELICVGTSIESSRQACDFARAHSEAYAAIGVHPHETKDGWKELEHYVDEIKVVAIGEIGLDYFYTHSPRDVQIKALEWQIELAIKHNLPIIFHVREAFDDFWPLFDNFKKIRGVLHSFTDSHINANKALERGLLIGVNGISTFTRDESQKAMYDAIPLHNLLFETDAPFLTPAPFRGKVNEPAFVKNIAQYHSLRRDISVEEIAQVTTANARALFAL